MKLYMAILFLFLIIGPAATAQDDDYLFVEVPKTAQEEPKNDEKPAEKPVEEAKSQEQAPAEKPADEQKSVDEAEKQATNNLEQENLVPEKIQAKPPVGFTMKGETFILQGENGPEYQAYQKMLMYIPEHQFRLVVLHLQHDDRVRATLSTTICLGQEVVWITGKPYRMEGFKLGTLECRAVDLVQEKIHSHFLWLESSVPSGQRAIGWYPNFSAGKKKETYNQADFLAQIEVIYTLAANLSRDLLRKDETYAKAIGENLSKKLVDLATLMANIEETEKIKEQQGE